MGSKLISRFAVILILLVLFVILITGACHNSATTDEIAHITAGYAFLSEGKNALWFSPYHMTPPLLNMLEAALVYLEAPDLALQNMDGWGIWWRPVVANFAETVFDITRTPVGWRRSTTEQLGQSRFDVTGIDRRQSLLVARIPTMYLTLLLGALVCRWGRELFGKNVGMLSLLILALDPTIIAHGRLATTDVGLVTFGSMSLYMAWKWHQKPSWLLAFGIGLFWGATLSSKSSGILWLIACMMMLGIKLIKSGPRCFRSVTLFVQISMSFVVSLFIIWAFYHFTVGPVMTFPIPVPAPAYWETFVIQMQRSTNWVFALNLRQLGRWSWYLPLAFLLKNPLPFLLTIGISIRGFVRDIKLTTALILVFPLLYTLISFRFGVNIGYRYMLAIHPFLCLLAAKGLSDLLEHRTYLHYGFVTILIFWQIMELGGIYPNEIGYFNQLTNGTAGGYKYLADSNTEWGQSTDTYFAYVETHPDVIIRPTTKFFPQPGRYLINPAQLQGTNIDDPYVYEWFRHRDPIEILTNTLLLYEVPAYELHWIAQCNTPAIPLSDEAMVANIYNGNQLRIIQYDCSQSWIYPATGKTQGLYALHGMLLDKPPFDLSSFLYGSPLPYDTFMKRHLAFATLSYWQNVNMYAVPAFALYETQGTAVPDLPFTLTRTGYAEASLHEIVTEPAHSTPLDFAHDLTLAGVRAYFVGSSLEVESWWKVKSESITRPFSIMAHLVSSENDTALVADGLGISPFFLRNGDIFVQRHVFQSVDIEQAESAWLRIGVYWLDTLDRWRINYEDNADALFISIADTK